MEQLMKSECNTKEQTGIKRLIIGYGDDAILSSFPCTDETVSASRKGEVRHASKKLVTMRKTPTTEEFVSFEYPVQRQEPSFGGISVWLLVFVLTKYMQGGLPTMLSKNISANVLVMRR